MSEYEEDKPTAEAVLEILCKGAQIIGNYFDPSLVILIGGEREEDELINGQVSILIASCWKVFNSRPAIFPNGEDEFPDESEDEEIQRIASIRGRVITKIELGETEPHLILTLDDGSILFINGKHNKGECWEVRAGSFSEEPHKEESWLVIAIPSGNLAIWVPRKKLNAWFKKHRYNEQE